MKDKSRYTYSIPEQKDHLQVYNSIIKSGEVEGSKVDKLIYFPATLYDLEEVQYYYDEESKTFGEKSMAINFKVDEFRKQRSSLLKGLDVEFMKSLENKDCESCTEKIVNIKSHLRSLPNFLPQYLEDFTIEEITAFNCFNNVYDILIMNGGSGYEKAPTIEIEAPNGGQAGIQMKATATVLEGKVDKITITQIGSGYISAPKVKVSKPANGNVALVVASLPENDILK